MITFLSTLAYLFFTPIVQAWRVIRYRKHARSLVVLGGCALMVIVSGCGGATASTVPAITPVTMVPGAGSPATTSGTFVVAGSDWTTYHNDNSRTGYLPNQPDPHRLTSAWKTTLDGAVYAEPLVVHNHVIVATEGDSLYALDAASGKVLWQTNVGTPVDQTTLPCGDINPLGITGTPVYDPATGLVFAVAEIAGPAHILVGLDANTGKIRVRRSADIAAMEPAVHQQRAALALSKGMIYVAYGGLAGDCGNYHGTVIASRTDGTGPLLSYQLPTPREGGIWGPSGPTIDSAGDVYVAVGNGSTTQGNWDHTDSVLRLSATLKLEDGFAPVQWPQDNNSDADLGSMGPTPLPGGLIFIEGKSGIAYLLQANKLGGVGGQIQTLTNICNGEAMGGTASTGTQIFVPCSDGLRQVLVGPGPHITAGWRAPSAGIKAPPIIGGHTVYSLNASGTLYALNSDTGAIRAQVDLNTGDLPHFVTPTLSGNHIFVGTASGVVAAMLA
jgi:outer membrane protein assembly factor BamB